MIKLISYQPHSRRRIWGLSKVMIICFKGICLGLALIREASKHFWCVAVLSFTMFAMNFTQDIENHWREPAQYTTQLMAKAWLMPQLHGPTCQINSFHLHAKSGRKSRSHGLRSSRDQGHYLNWVILLVRGIQNFYFKEQVRLALFRSSSNFSLRSRFDNYNNLFWSWVKWSKRTSSNLWLISCV